MLETLFQVAIGLGSIPAQEQRLSQALTKPFHQVKEFLRQQAMVNVDETSWSEENDSFWLWVGCTPEVAVFLLKQTRGSAGVKHLIGQDYAGIVGSDRWTAYNWLPNRQRQLCWSHLRRDFQAMIDRDGDSAIIGQLLLAQTELLFSLWHRVRDGTLRRSAFQEAMQPVRREVEALLQLAVALVDQTKTQATCKNILKRKVALWMFVEHEGVEPTNNAAERALRRGVIWRRRSFGTQSQTGSRFVERILTAVISLRQQQRNVLDFLTDACQTLNSDRAFPSLLPGSQ
jgi:transposase